MKHIFTTILLLSLMSLAYAEEEFPQPITVVAPDGYCMERIVFDDPEYVVHEFKVYFTECGESDVFQIRESTVGDAFRYDSYLYEDEDGYIKFVTPGFSITTDLTLPDDLGHSAPIAVISTGSWIGR